MCNLFVSKVITQYVLTFFYNLVFMARVNDVVRKLNEGLRNQSVWFVFSCTSWFELFSFSFKVAT